jgi:hypothetical protein
VRVRHVNGLPFGGRLRACIGAYKPNAAVDHIEESKVPAVKSVIVGISQRRRNGWSNQLRAGRGTSPY